MATIINAGTTALTITPDTTGALTIQANGTNAIAIDTSQNIGIGTITPATSGGTALVVNHSSTPRIRLTNSTTGQNAGDGAELSLFGSDFYIENREAANMIFYNNGAERMRIASDGGISAGSTTGTVGLGIWSNFGSRIIDFARYADDGAIVGFRRGATLVGRIDVSGSATSYVTSSDYRLKENIAPMTGALAKVSLLKPVTYKWKVDGSDGQGFIAHELAEVVPQAVSGEKDAIDSDGNPEYQGIDTSFLVATLTAAIQEQQTIINDLKARIETLENS